VSCRTENENDLTNAQAYHRKNSAQEITRLEGKRCALGRDARRQRMLLLVNQLVPHHADPEGRREGCRAPGALEESNSRDTRSSVPPEPSTSPCGREGPRLRGGRLRPAQRSEARTREQNPQTKWRPRKTDASLWKVLDSNDWQLIATETTDHVQ
jgi:hypothetical protein